MTSNSNTVAFANPPFFWDALYVLLHTPSQYHVWGIYESYMSTIHVSHDVLLICVALDGPFGVLYNYTDCKGM